MRNRNIYNVSKFLSIVATLWFDYLVKFRKFSYCIYFYIFLLYTYDHSKHNNSTC